MASYMCGTDGQAINSGNYSTGIKWIVMVITIRVVNEKVFYMLLGQ